MPQTTMCKILSCFIVVFLISTSLNGLASNTDTDNKNIIQQCYHFDNPVFKSLIIQGQQVNSICVENLPIIQKDGEPCIPVKPVRFLLPPSTTVKKITVEVSNTEILESNGVEKINIKTRSFHQGQKLYTSISNDTGLYTIPNIQYFRGYPILNMNLHPVQYNDATNTFYFHKDMSLTIELQQAQKNPLYRGNIIDQKELLNKIDNPEVLDEYQKYSVSPHPCHYDYLIITTEDLKNSHGLYTLNDLVKQREGQGLSCMIKTVEDIKNEYDGIDTQEKIRNFIEDAYLSFGVTWVLLAGDVEKVPIRYLYDIDGDEPDRKISSDIYYQCLDGNYNYNNDHHWGEKYDGVYGRLIDLYAEVYIGRAPVDDACDISSFVEKTLTYENSNWQSNPYLSRCLSIGERLWGGLGGWGSGYVERCIDKCTDYNHVTHGIPSSTFNITRLYERDNAWSKSDLIAEINEGVGIINHVGHGTIDRTMEISTYDISTLNNAGKYCLLYSQACDSGKLEAQDECFAERWVNAEKAGGFAAIMNTRNGYGSETDYDGPDNRYAREFFDALFSPDEKISRIGKANQDSKEDNIWRIDESEKSMYHVYYDTLLFGDPYVQIKGAEGTHADFAWYPVYPLVDKLVCFSDVSTGDVIHWSWDMGDGTAPIQEANPVHYYSSAGNYSVTLTILDRGMNISSTTYNVEVRDRWPPIAIASPEYYSGDNFTVNFSGEESWDPDGEIVSYEWDFDDGSISNQCNLVHIFSSEGFYNVQLTVTDNDGQVGLAYCDIGIGAQMPPYTPCKPSGPINGTAGVTYMFMTTTTDPENDCLRYIWDFDDGENIRSKCYMSGETCIMSYTWNSNGVYHIRVKAVDLNMAESNWSDDLVFVVGDSDTPSVTIIKPGKAFYLQGKEIRPYLLRKPFILGEINITVNATDVGSDIDNVMFYIDNNLMNVDNESPYAWVWEEKTFGQHTIKVVAYDLAGNCNSDQLIVWKFL